MKLKSIGARLVLEASLTRMMKLAKTGEFAIISASRITNSPTQNRTNNQELVHHLNSLKLDVHSLIGHWQECQDPDISYEDCPEELKQEAIEQSYFVACPEGMDTKDFEHALFGLCKVYQQDAIILGIEGIAYVALPTGELISQGGLSMNKLGQVYSQHIKKKNVPFVFEGLEVPINNISRISFKARGLQIITS